MIANRCGFGLILYNCPWVKKGISSSHLCKMQFFIMIRGANFIWVSARHDSNTILSVFHATQCVYLKGQVRLFLKRQKDGWALPWRFCNLKIWLKKHKRKKYNTHISSSHICGLFKNSLSSNHGRKTCRTVKWPQGIYVCFHDCNLTASKCRLKGCLCVPELSFVLALMAEGLYRELPHRATAVNDLGILCQVTFSTRPPPWPSFLCCHNVCSAHWPGLGRLELPS